MAYIGNEPISAAFLVDTFSGNGSTVAFTMSVAPANTSSIIVAITGVVQDPSTYSVAGTTLTFSAAPPSGTSNISVRYLGIPASGVTTTAYRTVTDTTATAGQTTFTIPSYTVGYVDVYRNGVRLAAADYTATTGTTVVLASGATAGDTITTESFYVSSVLNAIPQYNGTSVNQTLTTPTANTLTSGSGSSLQLQTNGGTTALTLDTSGNAGLGVTPSAWNSAYKALQFSTTGALFGESGEAAVYLACNSFIDSAGTAKYLTTDFASRYNQENGAHKWLTAASGTAGGTVSFTQAMTLDASGNLGVGVTSPAGRLDVGSSGSTKLFVRDRSDSDRGIYLDSGTSATGLALVSTNTASRALGFATNDTERARIDSSGNLLVGTTSTVSNARFVVVGSVADDCARIINQNASPYGLIINYSGATPNNSSNQFIDGYDNNYGNLRFKMQSNGGLGNYQANNTNLSDRREKTNFAPAGDYLAKICAIPVQTFNYIDQNLEEDDGLTLGVVAQDVQAVAPELVTETNWAGKDAEPKMRLSIYQTDLQYALMKSIQELKAIVDAQAAEIAALKGQE